MPSKSAFRLLTILTFFTTSLVVLAPASSQAKKRRDAYTLPKLVAVHERAYTPKKDLTFQVGLLPSDAFNRGYIIGTSYTHFFRSYLGWEVINLNYSLNQETSLKSDLEKAVDIVSQGFEGVLDYITYTVSSNVVYTPLYTKSLLFNDKVVYGETSFTLGGGAVHLKKNGLRVMLNVGAYLRFYNESGSSWKFDFRNNIYSEDSQGIVNSWAFSVGYALAFGTPNF